MHILADKFRSSIKKKRILSFENQDYSNICCFLKEEKTMAEIPRNTGFARRYAKIQHTKSFTNNSIVNESPHPPVEPPMFQPRPPSPLSRTKKLENTSMPILPKPKNFVTKNSNSSFSASGSFTDRQEPERETTLKNKQHLAPPGRPMRKSLNTDEKYPTSKIISPVQASYTSKDLLFNQSPPQEDEEEPEETYDIEDLNENTLHAEYRKRVCRNAKILKRRLKNQLRLTSQLEISLSSLESNLSSQEDRDELSLEDIESSVHSTRDLFEYSFGDHNEEYGCSISDLKNDICSFLVSKDFLPITSMRSTFCETESSSSASSCSSQNEMTNNNQPKEEILPEGIPLHRKRNKKLNWSNSLSIKRYDIKFPGDPSYNEEDAESDELFLKKFITGNSKAQYYENLRIKFLIQKNLKKRAFLEKALFLITEAEKIGNKT